MSEKNVLLPGNRDVGLPRLWPAEGLCCVLRRGLRRGLLRGPEGPFLCGEIKEPSQSSSSSSKAQSGSPKPREEILRRSLWPSWRNRGGGLVSSGTAQRSDLTIITRGADVCEMYAICVAVACSSVPCSKSSRSLDLFSWSMKAFITVRLFHWHSKCH